MAQASSSSEERAINLAAIEKTDKFGSEVLDKCTSSALYKYAQGKWEKCNCDGVFLLYRRSVAPLYAFIVLNKRSTQNHVQHITKAMGLQLQSPFLLYRTESGEIHGMWFYTQRDCLRIADQVGKLVVSLGGDNLRVAEDRSAAASKAKTAPTSAVAPSATVAKQQQQQQAPVVPGSDAAHSILQMLSRAQTDFKHREGPQQQQQQQPKVISVDSLFGSSSKQQPPPVSNGGPPLPLLQQQQPQPHRDQYAEMSHQIKEQLGLLTGLQQKQQQQQQKPSDAAVCHQADEEEEEFLLTPGMLECAASQLLADCPQPPPQPQPLMSPSSGAAAVTQSPPQPREQQQQHQSVSGDIPALTKEQLRESLLYLLENDDAFLGSLHRAYVASLQRRLTLPRV